MQRQHVQRQPLRANTAACVAAAAYAAAVAYPVAASVGHYSVLCGATLAACVAAAAGCAAAAFTATVCTAAASVSRYSGGLCGDGGLCGGGGLCGSVLLGWADLHTT